MNINATTDFASIVDNTETVTFRSLGPGGTFTDTAGIIALRRSLSRQEIAALGGGALAHGILVWNLEAGTLSPKTGDRVQDSNNVEYVVEAAELVTFGSRWRLQTRKKK